MNTYIYTCCPRSVRKFSKILVLLCAVVACSEDVNKKPEYAGRQLLGKYDWILFSVVRVPEAEPEPELQYVVLSFTDSTYRGSDFAGKFYELGKWKLENGVLTLNNQLFPLLELTSDRLIYQNATGDTYTRIATPKIN